jgi:hypothetical protein
MESKCERAPRSSSQVGSNFPRVIEWARKWKLSHLLSIEKIQDLLTTLAIPPVGRTRVEMDDTEYERMRDALGSDWEWRGTMSIWVNGIEIDHEGGDDGR